MQGTSIFRRMLVTAVLAAVTVLLVGGLSLASASDGSNASVRKLVLQEKTTNATFVDVNGHPGGGPGDEFIIHATLSNSSGRVGTLDIVCVYVFGQKLRCSATNTLPGGTIVVSALVPVTDQLITIQASIDGGTGRYDEASGQVTSVQHSATTATDTFDID